MGLERLKEYLQEEKQFDCLKDALEYAVFLQREKGEDLAVYQADENIYCTIHTVNAELAIQLGYKPVVGFTEILFVSESDKNSEEALKDFYESVKEKNHF